MYIFFAMGLFLNEGSFEADGITERQGVLWLVQGRCLSISTGLQHLPLLCMFASEMHLQEPRPGCKECRSI